MKKYEIIISENVLSIYFLSENFDYMFCKEIKSAIEKTVLESESKIAKIILHLDNVKFIDSSGLSLFVHIHTNICENIILCGCKEETINIINQLQLDKHFNVK